MEENSASTVGATTLKAANILVPKCLNSSLVNSIIRESETLVKKKQQKIGPFREFSGREAVRGLINRACA